MFFANYLSSARLFFIVTILYVCCNPNASAQDIPQNYFKVVAQLGNRSLHIPVKYFFWSAGTEIDKGFLLSYERNIFSTPSRFSLHLGANSGILYRHKENISVYSLYLAPRFWIMNFKNVRAFLNVSAGGLSLLSKNIINNRKLGSKFIFQDFIGLGIQIGKKIATEVSLNFYHYSNGSLLKNNPGFDIPACLSVAIGI